MLGVNGIGGADAPPLVRVPPAPVRRQPLQGREGSNEGWGRAEAVPPLLNPREELVLLLVVEGVKARKDVAVEELGLGQGPYPKLVVEGRKGRLGEEKVVAGSRRGGGRQR